jgi:AcrR family transcriptional regulator
VSQTAPSEPEKHQLHPTAQKILAAAKRILTERGYQGLTLQAISAEAHVNKSGVWYYFGGKQQLVLALLDDVAIRESHHFGALPPAGATLVERVYLIVGGAEQVGDRVRRYAPFYELLPEASRDAELHKHLMTYYESWYEWAAEVLSPPVAGSPRAADSPPAAGSPTNTRRSAALGQFASILLDGIFMQMVVASPDFDLEAALEQAREALMHLIASEAGDQPESASPQRTRQDRR